MAELTPLERLQPALLDRLSDDAPDKTQETREARLITRQKLRAAVIRDLAWLLNSTRPNDGIDWASAPQAEPRAVQGMFCSRAKRAKSHTIRK